MTAKDMIQVIDIDNGQSKWCPRAQLARAGLAVGMVTADCPDGDDDDLDCDGKSVSVDEDVYDDIDRFAE